ncbi:uncharacterized protein LOC135847736 isoform X3 [Planococcus citri]|uniref:uncharacterized protein LOC135847736 isoform X3 n=1 Tax=Planococcus citri TaxID=170843 RepID=UPI0031F7DA0B
MEVQQHQGLEMAQVTSKLFDIFHPTPVSLKQLSAIAVSLEIWRRKVNEYRINGKLEKFSPWSLRKRNTWIKDMLPDLPSTIYKTIEEVFSRFGQSFGFWQNNHCSTKFCYKNSYENDVLEYFDDFVCDYDGSIHYARTAERMMHCEGFSSEMKFIVACMYFFEDEIRQIWPSVSANMNLYFFDFDECPQLYYWICRLTNKLDEIPTQGSETVDERMFAECMPYITPSVEYFWNRVHPEKRMQIAIGYLDGYDFVRFVLPKLDDEQLDKYINDGYGDDLCTMFLNLRCDEWIVLRTWFHIRNIIKESNFTNFIFRMVGNQDDDVDEFYEQEKWEYLCCQIWNHTPLNLKQSVIRVFSSESRWFESIIIDNCDDFCEINVELLLLILQDASSKERSLFWCNNWSYVIVAVRCKNLQRVIELCFEDANKITEFKQNIMINSRSVLLVCISLLQCACFEELNAFVSFVCTELQAARFLKQRILQSTFFDEDYGLEGEIIGKIGDLNEFINDAFDNVDLSTDFKNLLMSSSSVMKTLSKIICLERVSCETLITFIDTLVATEETVMQVKKSLIDSLKERLTTNAGARCHEHLRSDPEFNLILSWCLGSSEGVDEFKLNCGL